MEKWEIRPPLPQKRLNRSSPKSAWVIRSKTSTLQNFITIRLPLSPPNMRKCASSDSASSLVLPSAYSQYPCTDFYDQYVKWPRLAQGCAFWGIPKTKFYISTPFSSENTNFSPMFDGTKFRVKKALTMARLICKLPLIVIVAQWKLYSK